MRVPTRLKTRLDTLMPNRLRSFVRRYFRRNEGSTDYATHSSVTVDRIVMDVLPKAGNGNLGLPTGAPAVTDNVWQTINFTYSGSISELCRNGNDYFAGIIANVKYYLAGQLVRSWAVRSNSASEDDSESGSVMNFINPNPNDWGVFERQEIGDWLGKELSNIKKTHILGDDSDPEFSSPVFLPVIGRNYNIGANFKSYTGTSDCGWSSITGIPQSHPFRKALAVQGDFIGGYFTCTLPGASVLFGRGNAVASFTNITFKEVLKSS